MSNIPPQPAQTGLATAPPTSPDAPETKPDAVTRTYIILKRTPADSPGGNERFEKVAVETASNPNAAVESASEKPGSAFLNNEGVTDLVAVSERYWIKVPVEVETTTRLKFS